MKKSLDGPWSGPLMATFWLLVPPPLPPMERFTSIQVVTRMPLLGCLQLNWFPLQWLGALNLVPALLSITAPGQGSCKCFWRIRRRELPLFISMGRHSCIPSPITSRTQLRVPPPPPSQCFRRPLPQSTNLPQAQQLLLSHRNRSHQPPPLRPLQLEPLP